MKRKSVIIITCVITFLFASCSNTGSSTQETRKNYSSNTLLSIISNYITEHPETKRNFIAREVCAKELRRMIIDTLVVDISPLRCLSFRHQTILKKNDETYRACFTCDTNTIAENGVKIKIQFDVIADIPTSSAMYLNFDSVYHISGNLLNIDMDSTMEVVSPVSTIECFPDESDTMTLYFVHFKRLYIDEIRYSKD